MSNIVEARILLGEALALFTLGEQKVQAALRLMTRERAVRRSKAKRIRIDEPTRRAIHKLALNRNLSMNEIGNLVGVRNQGRISEVLHGRR